MYKDLQKANGLGSISARVGEIEEDLMLGLKHLRGELAGSKALSKELKLLSISTWLGRMVEENQATIAELVDPSFSEAIQSLAAFRETLETGKGQPRSGEQSLENLRDLMERLDRLQTDLRELSSLCTILSELHVIEAGQRQQVEYLTGTKHRLLADLLESASQTPQKR